jgi:hypothetical protein
MRNAALSLFVVTGLTMTSMTTSCAPYACTADALVVDERTLADGTVGTEYDEMVIDQGFAQVVLVEGEALPPGLELVNDEARYHVRGTPTEAGAFTTKLAATEYSTQCSGRTAEFDVVIEVVE